MKNVKNAFQKAEHPTHLPAYVYTDKLNRTRAQA